ncbi:MAG: dipeptide epimerase [Gammaproteobacteria bacterium]|nr:dipeptide epimerase [Gammaproteobacteria bacterium]
MRFSVHAESWAVVRPFRITGHVWTSFESVVVELERNGAVGRGEALGVFYASETPATMIAQIEAVAAQLDDGLTRAAVQTLLPPGGARNALDCALWDLEAKEQGCSIWELTGVQPRELETVYTIGIEATPEAMAAHAAAAAGQPLLKIKLDGQQPLERLQAIRRARPDARLVVDANQGWTFTQLQALAPAFAELGVLMIEQPLPRGGDAVLEGYRSPVPLCADESCLHLGELEPAARRYQMINIKLDKTGGLTHALELARAVRGLGLGLMVGSMAGGSLAMAPAFVIGCLCDFVDIDGPLLLKYDRLPGLRFDGARVSPPDGRIWG